MSCRQWLFDEMKCIATSIANHYFLIFATSCLVIGMYGFGRFKKWNRRRLWRSAGRDVVVLHTVKRGKTSPSLTPFSIKLETFFRICKIKYELEFDEPMGPKGKVPWITMNGEEFTDSELIMTHLKKKFGHNLNSKLTKEQTAVAMALQRLVDEHLYWGIGSWRYIEDKEKRVLNLIVHPSTTFRFFVWYFKGTLKKMLWYQGLGRHSFQQLHAIMREDMQALSDYLGSKAFFMGNDPTEVDCAVFGQLSQFVWNAPGSPYLPMLQNDFKNLFDFCYRMKDKYWPDWVKS